MFASQSIQRPVGINVFGSCLIRLEPDYASLRFTVGTLAPEPTPALAAARKASAAVRQALARRGITDADVQVARLSLHQAYEGYGDTRKAIGYRVAIPYLVLVRQLGLVEDLLVEVVAAGAREIEGVSYKSSKLAEVRGQARRAAVAGARSKAELYAEAAGARVGRVLHLEDVNPDQLRGSSHMPDIDLSAHESGAGGSEGPGSIQVAAAVMVCFALMEA